MSTVKFIQLSYNSYTKDCYLVNINSNNGCCTETVYLPPLKNGRTNGETWEALKVLIENVGMTKIMLDEELPHKYISCVISYVPFGIVDFDESGKVQGNLIEEKHYEAS